MSLAGVFRFHFPGHRFKDDEGDHIADELSTKGRESNDELQAFNSVLLDVPSQEMKDPRKRGAPNGVSEPKRACLPDVAQESTPPRPPEIGTPPWEMRCKNGDPAAPAAPGAMEPSAPAAPVSAAPTKVVRTLPAFLKPSALSLELMNDKNYKFIMGLSLEEGRSK